MDEVRRIFDAALKLRNHRNMSIQNAWRQYHPFAILLFNMGLRYSEISGLKKDDFDFKRKTVTIKRTADKNGKVDRLKSAYAERTIPLPEMIVNEIRALSKHKQHGSLFSTASVDLLMYSNIRRNMWNRLLTEAGVRRLGFHAARHFYAPNLIRSEANLLEIKKYLGHHSSSFTYDQYGHLIDAESARSSQIAENSWRSIEDHIERCWPALAPKK